MRMTDRQFDSYMQSIYRNLETVKKEIEAKNVKSEHLEIMMKDIETQLKRGCLAKKKSKASRLL